MKWKPFVVFGGLFLIGLAICGTYVFVADKSCPLEHSNNEIQQWGNPSGHGGGEHQANASPSSGTIAQQPSAPEPEGRQKTGQETSKSHSWFVKFSCEAKAADIVLVFFTWCLVVATVYLGWATLRLWEAGEKQQRPWLGPNGEIKFTKPFAPVEGGYLTDIVVTILNAGHSPAFKVHVVAELYVADIKGGKISIDSRFKSKLSAFSEWKIGEMVFPNNTSQKPITLSLTDEEVLEKSIVIAKMQTFYPTLWVGVTYISSGGVSHQTHALYVMRGAEIGGIIPADQLSASMIHCEAT